MTSSPSLRSRWKLVWGPVGSSLGSHHGVVVGSSLFVLVHLGIGLMTILAVWRVEERLEDPVVPKLSEAWRGREGSCGCVTSKTRGFRKM